MQTTSSSLILNNHTPQLFVCDLKVSPQDILQFLSQPNVACQSLSLSALIYTSRSHQHLLLAPENSSSLSPLLLLLTPASLSFLIFIPPSHLAEFSPSPHTSLYWVQTTFKGRGCGDRRRGDAASLEAHA